MSEINAVGIPWKSITRPRRCNTMWVCAKHGNVRGANWKVDREVVEAACPVCKGPTMVYYDDVDADGKVVWTRA